MRRPAWVADLRTWLSGVDPGLSRLRLASVAVLAMATAAAVMMAVQAMVGVSVTVVLFAAVLAMISNLSVNEVELTRQRVTTALMVLPASASVVLGTLLVPHRVAADVVFVLVMAAAVYIRSYGPRGMALGMAGFMPYFFTQFLQATLAELPWLLVAVLVGITATLVLRTWLFAERPARMLHGLLRAFRARLHALISEVAEVLAAGHGRSGVERRMRAVRGARARLNDTALLVADQLDRLAEDDPAGCDLDGLTLRVLDAELAAERLAVAARRMLECPELRDPSTSAALIVGVRALERATESGTSTGAAAVARGAAGHAVAGLITGPASGGNRVQRVGFAVVRLSEALALVDNGDAAIRLRDPPAPVSESRADGGVDGARPDTDVGTERVGTERVDGERPELRLATRQAVQVAVATSLAIVAGEVISPARWYWAVIAAFVVFAGTTSRGDLLNRGLQRVVGTIGGVFAGVGLAAWVGDARLPALALMLGCVFLAMYLVRVSQALMAFWVTAVLALLYGLIGQFSAHTLLVRVEETAVGAALGILAGFLILPKRTRDVFGEALDDTVDAADAVLAAATDRLLGRPTVRSPLALARDMDVALGTLRARVKPLDNPLPGRRGRTSYHRALRVLTAVDHYARALARSSMLDSDPGWAPTLRPAVDRVRGNVEELRRRVRQREPGELASAEDLIDAAEECAARAEPFERRLGQLAVTRLIRRLDQAVVGFAGDLGSPARTDPGVSMVGRPGD